MNLGNRNSRAPVRGSVSGAVRVVANRQFANLNRPKNMEWNIFICLVFLFFLSGIHFTHSSHNLGRNDSIQMPELSDSANLALQNRLGGSISLAKGFRITGNFSKIVHSATILAIEISATDSLSRRIELDQIRCPTLNFADSTQIRAPPCHLSAL